MVEYDNDDDDNDDDDQMMVSGDEDSSDEEESENDLYNRQFLNWNGNSDSEPDSE